MDNATMHQHFLLEAKRWHELRQKGELSGDEALRKGYIADEVEILKQDDGQESRDVRFIVSTEALDRDRDIIQSKGWDLEAFEANPVVLWAHDHRTPAIAMSPEIAIKRKKLQAIARFAEAEANAFADMIFRLVKGGFLKATSVGFLPQEFSFDEDRRGVNFIKQELLEFSIVNVPANPEALIAARSGGISLAPMVKWAEEILDATYEEQTGIYLPRAVVERAHAIAAGEPVSVQIPADIAEAVAADVASKLGLQLVQQSADEEGEIRIFQAEGAQEETTPAPGPEVPDLITTSIGNCARCGKDHEDLQFRKLEAPVQAEGQPDLTHFANCPKNGQPLLLRFEDKGTIPRDVTRQLADEDTAWSRPRLRDFTTEPFDELSAAQRRRIAGHFAWTEVQPPASFGQLKLPHHRASDGLIVLRGVNAAMAVLLGARGGVDVPDGDRRPIYNHLASHLRQFDREPPEFRYIEAQVLRTMPELFEWDEEKGKLTQPATGPEETAKSGADLLLGLPDGGATEGPVDLLQRVGSDLIGQALEPVVDSAVKRGIAARTGRLPD